MWPERLCSRSRVPWCRSGKDRQSSPGRQGCRSARENGRLADKAGAKGVGRFSCDRLGKQLVLTSRAEHQPVQILAIDWTRYEEDFKKEFAMVEVELSEASDFPNSSPKPPGGVGTVLEIRELRSAWDRTKFLGLKRELAKLINPFAPGPPGFKIDMSAPAEKDADKEQLQRQRVSSNGTAMLVNGTVRNDIREVLKRRTTAVRVSVHDDGAALDTILEDRGEVVYRIREPNPYEELMGSGFRAEVCFLNHSAKMTFKLRMGLPSVQFGSVFLFRNGFRVFPIGQEHDDFFSLSHRGDAGASSATPRGCSRYRCGDGSCRRRAQVRAGS